MKLDFTRTAPGYVALQLFYMRIDGVDLLPSVHLFNLTLLVWSVTLHINGRSRSTT